MQHVVWCQRDNCSSAAWPTTSPELHADGGWSQSPQQTTAHRALSRAQQQLQLHWHLAGCSIRFVLCSCGVMSALQHCSCCRTQGAGGQLPYIYIRYAYSLHMYVWHIHMEHRAPCSHPARYTRYLPAQMIAHICTTGRSRRGARLDRWLFNI
jgi:hypothetical protein